MGKVGVREKRLLEILKIRKAMDVPEIMNVFQISESTARRMCSNLSKQKKVIRTFGGIQMISDRSVGTTYLSGPYSDRSVEHLEKKRRIGKYASRFVSDGDVIFISGGTTTFSFVLELCKRFKEEQVKNVLVITNSIDVAGVLGDLCRIVLTGGEYFARDHVMIGSMAEQLIQGAHFNECFVGADGIDISRNLLALDIDTASMYRLVTSCSDRVYLLADSNKFFCRSFISYEKFNDKYVICTDNSLPADILTETAERGITVKVV